MLSVINEESNFGSCLLEKQMPWTRNYAGFPMNITLLAILTCLLVCTVFEFWPRIVGRSIKQV